MSAAERCNSGEGMRAYAAYTLFQPHNVRQAIRDAHAKKIPPLIVWYAGLSSIPTVRLVAPMNFDAVWIDWEHTACGVETLTTMIHDTMFMSGGRTIPWVRVPGHDHAMIGWAVDAGASIVVPQVNTVEEARHVVAATKFGGKIGGTRSVPPFRLVPGLTDRPNDPTKHDVWTAMNDQAAVMIQIESKEGIDNLDAILTEVADIDMVWFGSFDARVNMGFPGTWVHTEPEWLAIRDRFMSIVDKHDKPYGGFALGGPEAFRAAGQRMSFMVATSDVTQIMGMQKDLAEARGACADLVVKEQNGVEKKE